MHNQKGKVIIGFILLWIMMPGSYALDTVSSLMKKIKASPTPKLAYVEIRNLQLLNKPWQGSGYLYSLPPELMIREQIEPQRLLTGIKGNTALYFDPKGQERHQIELNADNELSVPLGMFKALVNADEVLLQSLFHLVFSSDDNGWTLALKPKKKQESIAKITVTGPLGQRANHIHILQEDGDSSEFILKPLSKNDNHNIPINTLYRELAGE